MSIEVTLPNKELAQVQRAILFNYPTESETFVFDKTSREDDILAVVFSSNNKITTEELHKVIADARVSYLSEEVKRLNELLKNIRKRNED